MPGETRPEGRPLAVDVANSEVPGFLARPTGAPVYHGFRLLDDVEVDGFILGTITDFESAELREGDAFVVAPDNSRAGLVWEISDDEQFAEVRPMERDRWGVWAVAFPFRMTNRENARLNLEAILPKLKSKWEQWRRAYGASRNA